MDSRERKVIRETLKGLERKLGCVSFKEASSGKRVMVGNSKGDNTPCEYDAAGEVTNSCSECWCSELGPPRREKSKINLGYKGASNGGCLVEMIIEHEFIHSLGLNHDKMRPHPEAIKNTQKWYGCGKKFFYIGKTRNYSMFNRFNRFIRLHRFDRLKKKECQTKCHLRYPTATKVALDKATKTSCYCYFKCGE
jgi:hypothetical protein